jgi:hypothetical protein
MIESRLHSFYIAQTGLPDLTQPQYLIQIASQLPIAVAIFIAISVMLTAGMALVNFSRQQQPPSRNFVLGDMTIGADRFLQVLQHTVLVSILILGGFLFCSTIANRQGNWERARVAQTSPDIAGETIQQTSPQVTYTTQEPYVYTTQLDGKLVKVQDKKDVTRKTSVSASSLQVNISPTQDNSSDGKNYLIDFKGDYQVTNTAGVTSQLIFQISPPTGYSLLQNFDVEQNGKKLAPTNPGEYNFPLQVPPGRVGKLRVSYRAQGSPQWIYSPKDGSLANFGMTISTKVPKLNFLGEIVPTKVNTNGEQKAFIWSFDKNASVQKPFGVVAAPIVNAQSGALPLLLLVAPGILLWWMLLLYFSIPMRLTDAAICGLIFFASMFTLTYFSRLSNPIYAWVGISIGLLALVWGLGRNNWRISVAAIVCTIAGVIAPVSGFLIGYRGLTLSVAGLLSILWLTARNWYGLYELEPKPKSARNFATPENTDEAFTRHDLLEESGNYPKANPTAPDPEETTRSTRKKATKSE